MKAYLLGPNGIIQIEFSEVVRALSQKSGKSEEEIRKELLTITPFTELKGLELVLHAGTVIVSDETAEELTEDKQLSKADYMFINPYYIRSIIRHFSKLE